MFRNTQLAASSDSSFSLNKDEPQARAGIQLEAPLFQIPDSLMCANVLARVQNSSLSAFVESSFYSHKLAQPELDQRGIEKLFVHIVNGEFDEVKKMLEVSPRLALVRRKPRNEKENLIKNKAEQCIDVKGKTAYMLALGEEDTEIAAMLKAAIVKVADEKEADAQYYTQFPERWEKAEAKRWALVFVRLDALTQAVKNAKPDDIISSGDPKYKLTVRKESAVAQGLAQFRASCDVVLNKPVMTGRHFNLHLLLRVLQIYADNYENYFGNDWNDPRAMLFWQQGIGYIERFFPANYAQAACDGFANTEEKLRTGTPQGRTLKFVYHPNPMTSASTDFYPLSASRLGFDFAIPTSFVLWARVGVDGGMVDSGEYGILHETCISELMSIKNSRRIELTQYQDCRREASRPSCLVM